jgi:chromosome partitioning protein
MPTLSIAIQKGGSGKTTTVVNLAAALVRFGRKVLVVDADPQANLTSSLGLADEPEPNLYHLLKRAGEGADIDVPGAIIHTKIGVDLLPATLELAAAEMELVSVYGREHLLAHILSMVKDRYDFIIIDCPPSIGILTVNALVASEFVIMPLQPEFLPMKGLRSFMRSMEIVRQRLNRHLELLGIVMSRYDERRLMNRQIARELEAEFGDKVFKSRIRSNIAIAKAQEQGVDIFTFDQHAAAAHDYRHFALEFVLKIAPKP